MPNTDTTPDASTEIDSDTSKEAATKDDWTPERIRALRHERGQTQLEFGRDLMSSPTGSDASIAKTVSQLETGRHGISRYARRTLERMEAGEL